MGWVDTADKSPVVHWGAAALVLVAFEAAGAYFVWLGVRTVRSGQFQNQRTGELIVGRSARALGIFLLVLGGLGCAVPLVAVMLNIAYVLRRT